MAYENPKEVYSEYMSGKLSADEAAAHIDSAIGGITGVEYKEGLKFTIKNHIQKYSLGNTSGMRKKELEHVYALLNSLNNYTNGRSEIHIAKGISSKHYKGGLNAVLNAAG